MLGQAVLLEFGTHTIDKERAEAAYQKAEKVLNDQNASNTDLRLAEAKLHRALVRKSVASGL